MSRVFTYLIGINGNLVPVIPMISDDSICAHPGYSHLSLPEQVEIMAKFLKREDHIQLVLMKQRVDNSEAVIKLAGLFAQEEVEVVGICCQEITKEALETLSYKLRYGVVDGPKYIIGEPKTYKKH